MRLYIIRHADPDYPNNTITPLGHREAQALVPRMRALEPDRLYSSPLGRALHTAQYTVDALGMPLDVQPWTQEIHGTDIHFEKFGRLVAWDAPGELIRETSPLPTHDSWQSMPLFKDNKILAAYHAIAAASDAFLASHGYVRTGHRYRIDKPNKLKLAIFCHGGLGLTWLSHLLAIPAPLMWSSFWLAPTSVTTVLFDERSTDWAIPRCIGLCDVSHLYAAGIPTTPHGLKANID